jgi:quinol monooxygenase YgiN
MLKMTMKKINLIIVILCTALMDNFYGQSTTASDHATGAGNMMIRIAEFEIHPEYLEDYVAILTEESKASVRLEPGVICIYPMYQKENPTQIRLLEIYTDNEAYQSHLQTPHFKHYKATTIKMVKSLKLIEMEALDIENMPKVFQKMNESD